MTIYAYTAQSMIKPAGFETSGAGNVLTRVTG